MTLALEDRAMKDDILIADTPKAQRRKRRLRGLTHTGRLWKHSKIADINGIVPQADLDDMLVFTLVRNPWDRMVSYYHWLQDQGFDHPSVRLAQSVGFAQFLHDPGTRAAMQANPYSSYVQPATNAVYVRLEHLQTDLGPVAAHLGFTPHMTRVNTSDRARDWRGYYSAADVDHVAKTCAADVAQFGYVFEK